MYASANLNGPLVPGPLIGEGGEGKVFEIVGAPDLVLKQYHHRVTAAKSAKLDAMVAMSDQQVAEFAAWPLKLVKGRAGVVEGVVMPRVQGGREINALYSPKARRQHFPAADWRFLIQAAANLAGAFANVHSMGCVVGDVNQSSVLVRPNAQVVLIDCDSFQVKTPSATHYCEVGVPLFTAPELQDRALDKLERNTNQDSFGLAVLIFHLLFMGRHPFAGRPHDSGDLSIERAIKEYRFAFSRDRQRVKIDPPPYALPLSSFPPPMVDMFELAFGPNGSAGGRPTAVAWHSALTGLAKTLKRCPKEPAHVFADSAPSCPWCEIELVTGASLFRAHRVNTQAPQRPDDLGFQNLEGLWQTALRVPRPSKAVEPNVVLWGGTASASRNAKFIGLLNGARVVGSVAAGIGSLFALGNLDNTTLTSFAMAGGTSFGAAYWIFGIPGRSGRTKIIEAKRTTQERWKSFIARWKIEASTTQFDEILARLDRLRKEHTQLVEPVKRKVEEQRLAYERSKAHWQNQIATQATEIRRRIDGTALARFPLSDLQIVAAAQDQYFNFLDRHLISKAAIADIGPGRVLKLASYGIESAGDITKNAVLKVPGFGEHLVGRLLAWRKTVEQKFKFDLAAAKAAVDSGSLAMPTGPEAPRPVLLDMRIRTRAREIETEFLTAHRQVAQFPTIIAAARTRLEAEGRALAKEVRQADADSAAALATWFSA